MAEQTDHIGDPYVFQMTTDTPSPKMYKPCPVCGSTDGVPHAHITKPAPQLEGETKNYAKKMFTIMMSSGNVEWAQQKANDYIKLEIAAETAKAVKAARMDELTLFKDWASQNIDPDTEVPIGSPAEVVFGKLMRHLFERRTVLDGLKDGETNNG